MPYRLQGSRREARTTCPAQAGLYKTFADLWTNWRLPMRRLVVSSTLASMSHTGYCAHRAHCVCEEPSPVDTSWTFRHTDQLHNPVNPTRLLPIRACKWTSYRSVFCATEGTSPAHSLRLLLLMAGIESNPGPIAERAAGKPCDACGGKIRKAPGKPEEDASHFKCADAHCGSVCHTQTVCSATPRAQWSSTVWYCRTHNPSSSLGDNQRLPAPTQSSTPPASKCAKCGNGRMPNPIVCVQCNGAFHQATICSGLRNRYVVEAARPSWKCEQCKHPTRTVAPDPSQSSSSLPKPRCHSCKNKVAEGFLTCNSCGVATHQVKKCSGLDTRGAIESVKKNGDWTCNTCVVKSRPLDPPPNTTDDLSSKSKQHSGTRKHSIRIVQWNADGLNPKAGELRSFLQDHKIDVALIQETQLMEDRASPTILGYTAYPGPRKGADWPGGGLLTYVKDGIVFHKNGHSQRGIVELLSISIPQTGTKWLTLNNIYIPPGAGDTDCSWIPTVAERSV